MALPDELIRRILDFLGDDARSRCRAACLARDWRHLARESMCERWIWHGEAEAGYLSAVRRLDDDGFAKLARRAAETLQPDATLALMDLRSCEDLTLLGVLAVMRESSLRGRVKEVHVLGLHCPTVFPDILAGSLRCLTTPDGWVDAMQYLEFWRWGYSFGAKVVMRRCGFGDPPCDRLACSIRDSAVCVVCQALEVQHRSLQDAIANSTELNTAVEAECYSCRERFAQARLHFCAADDCGKQYCDECAPGSKPGGNGLALCCECSYMLCCTKLTEDVEDRVHAIKCKSCDVACCEECNKYSRAPPDEVMRLCRECGSWWCEHKCAPLQFTDDRGEEPRRCNACVRAGLPREP